MIKLLGKNSVSAILGLCICLIGRYIYGKSLQKKQTD